MCTKEQSKEYKKAYYQLHKEEIKSKKKAYRKAHKEEAKAYRKAHKEEAKAYRKADLNSNGETKHGIRYKSRYYLRKTGIKIPGYEIHHCFGYEDPSKFIYCSKSLHLKIHQYLRDNNIDASTDHWMAIRELVNANNEFVYIKA